MLIGGASTVVRRKRWFLGSIALLLLIVLSSFLTALSQGLVLLQPGYKCSLNDIHGEVHSTVSRLTSITHQVVSPLPWNCWHAELELMDDPPPGIAVMNGKRPFIYGTVAEPFPDTAVGVHLLCVDALTFSSPGQRPLQSSQLNGFGS